MIPDELVDLENIVAHLSEDVIEQNLFRINWNGAKLKTFLLYQFTMDLMR
jgi:hypothetical protein